MPGYWNAHSDLDWYAECGVYDAPPEDDDPDAWAERAYRLGWSACMQWEARVPPDELSAEAREMWFQGFDDAMDAPLGSGPEL